MTDINTVQAPETVPATPASATPPSILTIPVVKGKGTVTVDVNQVSDRVHQRAVFEGYKVVLNGGMHKVTPANIPDEDKRQAEAMTIAQKRVDEAYADTLKLTAARGAPAGKSGKSAQLITAARNVARQMVKAAIKAAGKKVSSYDASEITKHANALIVEGSEHYEVIFAQAEKNLAVAGKTPGVSIDLPTEVVAHGEDAKPRGKGKGTLSAKQAGMTEHRATTAN